MSLFAAMQIMHANVLRHRFLHAYLLIYTAASIRKKRDIRIYALLQYGNVQHIFANINLHNVCVIFG